MWTPKCYEPLPPTGAAHSNGSAIDDGCQPHASPASEGGSSRSPSGRRRRRRDHDRDGRRSGTSATSCGCSTNGCSNHNSTQVQGAFNGGELDLLGGSPSGEEALFGLGESAADGRFQMGEFGLGEERFQMGEFGLLDDGLLEQVGDGVQSLSLGAQPARHAVAARQAAAEDAVAKQSDAAAAQLRWLSHVHELQDGLLTFVFSGKSLGLSLCEDGEGGMVVDGVVDNSAAAQMHVPIGMRIASLNGAALHGLTAEEAQQVIVRAERPLTIVFAPLTAPSPIKSSARLAREASDFL